MKSNTKYQKLLYKRQRKSNVILLQQYALCILGYVKQQQNKKMPFPKSRHIARGKPHIIRYKGIVSDGLGSNRILDFGFWEELLLWRNWLK